MKGASRLVYLFVSESQQGKCVYDQRTILAEITEILKLANRFKVEWYVDCAPEPTLLSI